MNNEKSPEFFCDIVDMYIFSHFDSFDVTQDDLSEHVKKDKQEIIDALPDNLKAKVSCLVQGVINFMIDIEYRHMTDICLASIDIGKQLQKYNDRF